jgi:hypothetical protein
MYKFITPILTTYFFNLFNTNCVSWVFTDSCLFLEPSALWSEFRYHITLHNHSPLLSNLYHLRLFLDHRYNWKITQNTVYIQYYISNKVLLCNIASMIIDQFQLILFACALLCLLTENHITIHVCQRLRTLLTYYI